MLRVTARREYCICVVGKVRSAVPATENGWIMEQFLDGETLPMRLRRGFAALGNFDGFHLGHQAVVRRAIEQARIAGKPALVVTFSPHPVRLFQPDAPPFALTTLDQRLELFEAAGVDAAYVIRFDSAFAAVTAETFISDWLAKRLMLSGVVTGCDFNFGVARRGNTAMLRGLGAAYGFRADTVRPVEMDGAVISSTRIRALLRDGETLRAASLLTRPFSIRGTIELHQTADRVIGSPILRVRTRDYLQMAPGVYAVRLRRDDGRRTDAIASFEASSEFDLNKAHLELSLIGCLEDLGEGMLDVEMHEFLGNGNRFAPTAREDLSLARLPAALGSSNRGGRKTVYEA